MATEADINASLDLYGVDLYGEEWLVSLDRRNIPLAAFALPRLMASLQSAEKQPATNGTPITPVLPAFGINGASAIHTDPAQAASSISQEPEKAASLPSTPAPAVSSLPFSIVLPGMLS